MSDNMLGINEVRGTLTDLLEKLGSDKGDEWHKALKRFLRKENPWGVPDFIDCDADPFVPEGWVVVEHRKGGKFAVANLKKIQLFLSDGQKKDKRLTGKQLRKELEDKPVLNANVMNFFLKYPELIPEKWKRKTVYFWGTVYRHLDGNLCVHCLRWHGGAWVSCNDPIDDWWVSDNFVALAPV